MMRLFSQKTSSPTTPQKTIHDLARQNSLQLLKEFITSNPSSINALNEVQETALHIAARKGHVDVCKFLIEKGIDMYIRNEDGRTAMHVCCVNDTLPVYKVLLESSGDHYLQESHILLYISFEHRSERVCKYLLENGADPDHHYETYNGGGLYHLVEHLGTQYLTLLLAQHGANIYLKNNLQKYGLEQSFLSKREDVFLQFFQTKLGSIVKEFEQNQIDVPDPIFSIPPIAMKLTEDIIVHNIIVFLPCVPLYVNPYAKTEGVYNNRIFLRRVCKLWKYWIDKYLFLNWNSQLQPNIVSLFFKQSRDAGFGK